MSIFCRKLFSKRADKCVDFGPVVSYLAQRRYHQRESIYIPGSVMARLEVMATMMLGSAPCTLSHTAPKLACNHSFQRPRCPAAFQARRHVRKQLNNRAIRLAVHAAAATEQNVKMPSWEQMHKQLTTQYKLESVSPSDANKLVDSGKFVLVDVRPPDIFAKAHPEGAQSAPLFQAVNWAKPDFKKYLRAVAFMANGVT